MEDAGALEQSVRQQFPLLFGDQAVVSTEEFRACHNAVARWAVAAAQPALHAETYKQQWLLASASIGLFALVFFKVGEVRIGDVQVAVDAAVLIWYGVFLALLLASFLLRARLDWRRAMLARKVDADWLYRLQELVREADTRRTQQLHQWLELSHQIGMRYAAYDEALQRPSEPGVDLRVVTMDIAAMRHDPRWREELAAHERFIAALLRRLDSDVERFKRRVAAHDEATRRHGGTTQRRFEQVSTLFEQQLGPWFAMNKAISDLLARHATERRDPPELAMLQSQEALLKKTRSIGRQYLLTEIVLPALLALSALGYALWTLYGPASDAAPADRAVAALGRAG